MKSAQAEVIPIRVVQTLLEENLSDAGNARRLVALHGRDIAHIMAFKKWHIWNGKCWAEDEIGEIYQRAKDVPAQLLLEAAKLEDTDLRAKLALFALRSESERSIMAMMRLARDERGVARRPKEFDQEPFLFNARNGTIDQRTGQLHPHRRTDFITKIAPVDFNAETQCPIWDRYIQEATNEDEELHGFIRRATGYSLTGDTREEKFFFIYGGTGTGKTTFLESIKAFLGPYAVTADIESFLKRRNDQGPRNDIARLDGRRFVSSVEMDDGRRLAEGLVKMLTGGDRIVARALYQELFEFTPQFKLWIASNSAPRVRDDDDAVWRRLLRVPFDHKVPEDKRDPSVKATLKNSRQSRQAILNWALQGCLEWQERGLDPPAAVVASTEAYREENDPLRDFLDECCEVEPGNWVRTVELRDAYRSWAKKAQRYPISDKAMAERLKKRGFTPEKYNGHRGWKGLGLIPEGQ